jgi:hypothetical protein
VPSRTAQCVEQLSEFVTRGGAKQRMGANTSVISTNSHIGVDTQTPISSTSMNIDMTLATSYKPVLLCILKVCALMVFHYSSIPLLFATERYALVVAALYVDNWIASEYIVNTNICVAMIAGSLLVHELRDAGIQERVHGDLAHTVALSMLVSSNILVLVFGENHRFNTILTAPGAYSCPATPSSPVANLYPSKRLRYQQSSIHSSHHSSTMYTSSALWCVVGNCILLVILSTCSMPINTHDPILNNIRVWSFMILSFTWLYTVYYRELRYSTVAPFTPCVLRFSSILFLTPTVAATGGVLLLGCVLAVVYTRLETQQQETSAHGAHTTDSVYQPPNTTDKAVVVGRDTQKGSVISYRNPVVLQEPDSVTVAISNGTAPVGVGGSANGLTAAFGILLAGSESDLSTQVSVPTNDQPQLDYNTLFQQVMDEQSV